MKEGKKMKKLLTVIALLLAMVLLLSACGKDGDSKSADGGSKSNSIEGTWKLTDVRGRMSDEELKQARTMIAEGKMAQTFIFQNGKATLKVSNNYTGEPDEMSYSLNYTIKDNKLSMTEEGTTDTQEFEFKLNGDTLELSMDGGVEVFTRQK